MTDILDVFHKLATTDASNHNWETVWTNKHSIRPTARNTAVQEYVKASKLPIILGEFPAFNLLKFRLQLPSRPDFKSIVDYKAVLYHECAHSTGILLKRNSLLCGKFFIGIPMNADVAYEEITAEVSALVMLYLESKDQATSYQVTRTRAYIDSWTNYLVSQKLNHTIPSVLEKCSHDITEAVSLLTDPEKVRSITK